MSEQPQILCDLLEGAARRFPDRTAISDGDEAVTYRELVEVTDMLADRLRLLGVCAGDRVGVYLRKSIDAVASIFGILKAGAAYVPVDPNAPVSRNAYILKDCSVKAVLAQEGVREVLQGEFSLENRPAFLWVNQEGGRRRLGDSLNTAHLMGSTVPACTRQNTPEDLSYILYTSGSTGRPKGVMLRHQDAMSFVDWCSNAFDIRETDRCSSHAPFHFDLSILDIFVSIRHGAAIVLIGDDLGKEPLRLAEFISQQKISVWYSTPSALCLLLQHGRLESHDLSSLRYVLFAGEVFPIKHLRALQRLIPGPKYFNLYGPTETNVCTFYEVTERIPEDRTEPLPIGIPCSNFETRVIDDGGAPVGVGQEGELCVSGPGVMQGYWNLPDLTSRVFVVDERGRRWYRTGDVVVRGDDGNYTFLGRRDRMVKRRGYRVELGDIEACLYKHPGVVAVAVIARPDEDAGVRIKAFLQSETGERISIIALKRFCMENLPHYMVPDFFSFLRPLPHTSTGKIDYQKLKELW
jgi:amino acid adenylation domain-containing protein